MSDLLYTVFTMIDPEFEPEFNDWQTKEHVPLLLGLPGYQSVIRYQDCGTKHRYANFWHISSMADFENPQRLRLASTPWGLRLSPYRKRRIDFYVGDEGIGSPPPKAELDERFSVLIMETYRDADDAGEQITNLYRQKRRDIIRLPHVLDCSIYHAYENRGIEENCIFYYLSGPLQQVERDTIPPLDAMTASVRGFVSRTQYNCLQKASNAVPGQGRLQK